MSEIPDSYTEPLSNEIAPTGAWNLSGRKLKILWEEIHPVIVAYSWKDAAFRTCCENEDDKWRAKVINTIADWLGHENFGWKEDWPIYVGKKSHTFTHFHISTEKVILPWPSKPSNEEDIMLRYSVVGGLLPLSKSQNNDPRIIDLDKRMYCIKKECGRVYENHMGDPVEGDSILKLINQITSIVARGLTDTLFAHKFNCDPSSVITDIQFPDSVVLTIKDQLSDDVLINPSNHKIYINLPKIGRWKPVPDLDSIIDHILVRNASNPMYSNCY